MLIMAFYLYLKNSYSILMPTIQHRFFFNLNVITSFYSYLNVTRSSTFILMLIIMKNSNVHVDFRVLVSFFSQFSFRSHRFLQQEKSHVWLWYHLSDVLLWVYPLYVCGRGILKINIRELVFKPPYHLCFIFNPSLLYKPWNLYVAVYTFNCGREILSMLSELKKLF